MGTALKLSRSLLIEELLAESSKNKLLLTTESLSGNLSDFLKKNFYQEGSVIKIDNAEFQQVNDQKIVVQGKSDYLGIPGIDVEARFDFMDDGHIACQLEYDLIKRGQASNYWQFLKSFPGMPTSFTGKSPFHGDTVRSIPDEFIFREAKLVVSSYASSNGKFSKPVKVGINFYAYTSLYGSLKILQTILDEDQETLLWGHINRPHLKTNYAALSLQAREKRAHNELVFAWDFAEDLPGIHLTADLGAPIDLEGLTIDETCLKIYSPLEDWTKYDKVYEASKAIAGSLKIASADIVVDAQAVMKNPYVMTVYTRFQGLSIDNLTRLASSGSDVNLAKNLPDQIQSAVAKLKSLELLEMAFTLKLVSGKTATSKSLKLSYSMFKVGFRDLNWNIWEDHIVVDDLAFRFEVLRGSSTSVRASLTADTEFNGVPVTITGSRYDSQFLLSASLGESTEIPLNSFMKKYIPGVPAPGDLTIDRLTISLCPGKYACVMGTLASEPHPWKVEVASAEIEVEDLSFELTTLLGKQSTGSQKVLGYVSGIIEIDSVEMQVNYSFPKDISINTFIPEVKLSKLQKALTGSSIGGPKGFDFALQSTQLIAKAGTSGLNFKAMSTVPDIGMFGFQAGKIGSQWGGAAGIYLEDPRLSKIDGLDFLKPIDKALQLEDVTLIVSSVENAQFEFPTSAAFSGNQGLNSTGVRLPSAPSGVVKGLSIHGKWVLNSKNKVHKLLKDVFNLNETLPVTAQIKAGRSSAPSFHLFTTVSGQFEHAPFQLQLGLRFSSGASPEYYVMGRGEISVAHQKMLMDLGVSVTLSGFSMSGSLQGTLNIHGLKLSDMAIMGSINWAGIPGFGFAGRINTKAFQSSVVMLVDTANVGMVFAGSISELTAYKVVTELAGVKNLPDSLTKPLKKIQLCGTSEFTLPKSAVKSLDKKDMDGVAQVFSSSGHVSIPSREQDTLLVVNKKSKKWFLTNRRDNLKTYQIDLIGNKVRVVVAPQIYVCSSYTRIGALEFQPGFLLSACIRIFDFEAYASVEISPSKGIAIDAYINKPIIIADKNFFCLSDVKGRKGPSLSVSTIAQPQHAVPEYRSPHLYMNGRLKIMGLTLECYAKITSKTLDVDARVNLKNKVNTPVVKGRVEYATHVKANVGNLANFYASFASAFKVELALYLAGTKALQFNEQIAGAIELGLQKGKPYAILAASFKLCGQSCKVKAKLQPGKDQIDKAGQVLAKEVGGFFEDIYSDAKKFIQDVGKEIIKGFESTEKLGKALAQHYKQSAEDVAQAFNQLGKGVEDIAKTLDKEFKKSAKEIGHVLNDMGKASHDVGRALKFVGHGAEEIGKALSDVGHAPADIAKTLSHIKIKPNDIAKTLKKMNFKSKDIADALGGLKLSSKDLDKILKSVHIDTKSIEKSVNGAVSDVTEFFDDVGKAVGGLFKKKKKKKKKKRNRKPSPDEVCKNLSKVTDNYDFIHKKVTSVGHSKEASLKAIAKLKGPSRSMLLFMHKQLGNDDNVFRLLRSSGWSDFKVVKEMKNARMSGSRIAMMLKLNGYGPSRIKDLFTRARISNKVYLEAQKHVNSSVMSNASFFTSHKRYIRADGGGGKSLKADAKKASSHEKYQIILIRNKNSRETGLRDGCVVAIMTRNHTYLRADKKGGLNSASTKVGSWEKFVLVNHSDKGRAIKKGDTISLRSCHKKYIVAEQNHHVLVNRDKVGSWEKFVVK